MFERVSNMLLRALSESDINERNKIKYVSWEFYTAIFLENEMASETLGREIIESIAEAYFEPIPTFTTELFCKNI